MKSYWWQQMRTSIVHAGYRVVNEYEVEDDYESGTQHYTGACRQVYIPA
jgi:hypothetical protein